MFTPHKPAAIAGDKGIAPPERISQFGHAFFEGAEPVLTTMLNRPTSVAVLGIEDVTAADLVTRGPLPWVLVELPYARGLNGGHWLILSKSGALILGHALVGDAEGEALEVQPSHVEAIQETLNQILGAASTALMPLIQRSLGFGPAALHVVEDTGELPPDLTTQHERFWLVRAEATGPDGFRVELMLTIGSDLGREIATLGGGSDGAASTQASRPEPAPGGIGLILDVTLPVAVELGRARMQIQDVLKLAPGSIIELDKSAGDPVEILINGCPIAKGEVVVIDENFGVRLTSIVTASERIKSLR
jgi:flagellar motor switch protein FliN/FliY